MNKLQILRYLFFGSLVTSVLISVSTRVAKAEGGKAVYALFMGEADSGYVAASLNPLDTMPESTFHERRWKNYPAWEAFDWDSLLADTPDFSNATDPKTVDTLRRFPLGGESHGSEVPFLRALPAAFPHDYFFLVSSSGVTALRPDKLKGIQRYRWNTNTPAKGAKKDVRYGYLLLSAGGKAEPGFVLHASTKTIVRTEKREPKSSEELVRYRVIFPELGRSFEFVQMKPDDKCKEGCCSIRYRLEPLGPAANEIAPAAINMKCDV